ncbi:MAG: hypothetical protein K9L70_08945 [Thiohalocapsa sp.]|nr:hypothetical protein [Thiohalocapsa sp.]
MNQNTLPGGLIVVILGLATYAVVFAPETTRGWPDPAPASATAQAPPAAPSDAAGSPSPVAVGGVAVTGPQRMVGLYVRCDQGTHVGRVVDMVRSVDDDSVHAVVAVGGLWGLFERRVAMPLEVLRPVDGALRMQAGMPAAAELYAGPAMDARAFRSIDSTRGA